MHYMYAIFFSQNVDVTIGNIQETEAFLFNGLHNAEIYFMKCSNRNISLIISVYIKMISLRQQDISINIGLPILKEP